MSIYVKIVKTYMLRYTCRFPDKFLCQFIDNYNFFTSGQQVVGSPVNRKKLSYNLTSDRFLYHFLVYMDKHLSTVLTYVKSMI
jgi:hypothetical protein